MVKAALGATVTGQVSEPLLASSLVIVPCPWVSEIVAPEAAERSTKKVSSASGVVSPLTSTVTVFTVSPGLKVKVPELAT